MAGTESPSLVWCQKTASRARSRAQLDAKQRALQVAGVEFTNGEQPGVRLAKAASAHAVELGSASNSTIAAKAARRTAKATEKKR